MTKKTYVFEALNKRTGEQFVAVGKTMREACVSAGQDIKVCKCISRAEL